MQSDLVIAADRNFNLTAGIAEEILRIVVGQIAGIVLVNFGNNISTQKFLLCRTIYLNPGDDQRRVEIGSTNQPNSPRNLRRITRQCNQELVWFRTHCFALNNAFLPDSTRSTTCVQNIFKFHFTTDTKFFRCTNVEQIFFFNLKYHSFTFFLSLLSLLYHLLVSILHLFVTFLCFVMI